MEAPGVSSRGLWISLLAPLLFSSCPAVGGQNTEITQHPESVSVRAGETLTLTCTLVLTGANLPGGVRWYKDLDRSQPVYSDREGSSSRGERVVPASNTDFSINIRNILPEDAGTYYCVKLRAGKPETELAKGKGTVVSVTASPSQPSLRGPPGRITAGSRASFNCSAEGFSPREITVLWLKDGREVGDAQTKILDSGGRQSISYRVESTVEVLLGRRDVKSQLTCRIKHSSLEAPLQQDFLLGAILRVPPKVSLVISPPSPVWLNATVNVTCSMEDFYPGDANLELFTKDAPSRRAKTGPRILNSNGTFSLRSSLEVMATEDRNSSMFICLAEHNSQPVVNKMTTLFITMQLEDNKGLEGDPASKYNKRTILIIAVVICALLVMLVIAVIYLIQARHRKGKDSTSVRLHESEKSPGSMNQDPDPNNVAYADLNFDKDVQKRPRPVAESAPSEYATLQAVQPAPNNENVTYADLDMVQLSKAPKRPAPKAEEASSEYASVQIQKK
ncbi:tyrosine-protein phosphatase non-receptor type substrate 1-like [Candoia aspera]|uniref:tyrosine-protein phosphatase non-receptor type substrate 1-like n=1 Tax=Candoia aspera TaxID=51853 RepID=UPI002FD8342E